MNYIRTKNGIYELKTKMVFNHIKEYRLADTIEELCDEFVIVEKGDNQHKVFNKKDSDVFFVKDEHIDYFIKYNDFYGAIWTSKGLIYVAKMDSDGKLVLI